MKRPDPTFQAKYGPWGVVAGASVGMGAQFAEQLAAKGLHLVLVARREPLLKELAERLTAQYGVEIRPVALDLASDELLSRLQEATRDLDIGLLVYNAALGLIGRFLDQDLSEKLSILDINCRGPLILAHEFGRRMRERGGGGILLMTSLSAFQGAALISTYAATKAYNLVLGEGLWDELRDDGIDVLAFCAGATRTPNYIESQPQDLGWRSAPVMEAGPVVSQALAALGKEPSAVAGRANQAAGFVVKRLLSRRKAVEVMGRTMRAMYEK